MSKNQKCFPVPYIFSQHEALSQYANYIEDDDSACRQLHHIELQASLGQKLLIVVLYHLKNQNFSILELVPVPKIIRTEDGWVFYLEADSSKYTSLDGSEFTIIEVLELMLLHPELRVNNIVPQFDIIEWTYPKSLLQNQ